MDDLWTLPLPLWDKMLRAAVGYLFLLVVFRIIGRRQLGQLTNFDLVVTLLVANVLQNATIGPDDSLVGGLVGAATLLALNTVVAGTVFVSRRAEHLVDGDPVVLVRDGQVFPRALRRELITHNDLVAAVCKAGIAGVDDVSVAILESNGAITVLPRTIALVSVSGGTGSPAG